MENSLRTSQPLPFINRGNLCVMENDVKFPSYSKQELAIIYKVSYKTMKKWLITVPDLGVYVGKKYTPKQVKEIFNHLERP
jgi:hypothetical protein